MHNHNNFLLRNLLNIRDKYGAFNVDAIDNLVDGLRDELWEHFEKLPTSCCYNDENEKEIAFEKRARNLFISLFTPNYDHTISN